MLTKKASHVFWAVFFGLGLAAGCRGSERNAPKDAVEPPRTTVETPSKLLDYVEMTTGGAEEDATLPLIVAVHGLGDTPENFKRILQDFDFRARVVLPRAPTAWHQGFAWFTTRLAGGEWDALSKGIDGSADLVSKLLIHIAKTEPTIGKPVIWGFSQGGMISFAVAVNHPDTVGLSVPIGGMLPERSWPQEKKGDAAYPPIRALHGESDSLVPIRLCSDTVDRLKTLGFDAELKSYPGIPHSIDDQMRRDLFVLLRGQF